MRILLTCAGRRGQVVRAFQEAVGATGSVVVCDSSANAPAIQDADEAFVVPPVNDDGYIDALLSICEAAHIDLLVPALEPELPKLAAQRAHFLSLGTTPVVSSPNVVATCYDKLQAADFVIRAGLLPPLTFTSLDECQVALVNGEISFPLVVKPRWGVSSIGVYFPEDADELKLSYLLAQKQIARSFLGGASSTDSSRCILIQRRLEGIEYGLDVINDLRGNHVCTFAKRKLRMRAGQTDQAITIHDERFNRIGRAIGERLGHIGLLDCDVFATGFGVYVLDLNPRLGGGYPFSHLAGADYPAALVAWARGEAPEPRCFELEPNVMASREDSMLRHGEPARRRVVRDQSDAPNFRQQVIAHHRGAKPFRRPEYRGNADFDDLGFTLGPPSVVSPTSIEECGSDQ
jgi:carbamoyl-phosphate synthase large subunit